MNKLIVVFLGVLVGSIIPTASDKQEEVLGLAIVLVIGNVISESFFSKEKMRHFSIFLSSATIGVLSTLLLHTWNRLAQIITLIIFAIAAVTISVVLDRKEEKGKKTKNFISDVFGKDKEDDNS